MQPEGNRRGPPTTHAQTTAASSRSSCGVLFSTTDVHLQVWSADAASSLALTEIRLAANHSGVRDAGVVAGASQYARDTETRITLGEDGAAGLGTAVDFVTLRTFRPLADYVEVTNSNSHRPPRDEGWDDLTAALEMM